MADLNPAQSQAVRHLDGPSLVIAGAGSGKTRVITAKLSHLIDAGFTGRAIAAITFTNKAAAEMAERFAQQRKLPASERPTISTFHSLGMKMLRTPAGAPAAGDTPCCPSVLIWIPSLSRSPAGPGPQPPCDWPLRVTPHTTMALSEGYDPISRKKAARCCSSASAVLTSGSS